MKNLILVLLCALSFSSISFAENKITDVGIHYNFSFDTDNNRINKFDINTYFGKNGISFGYYQYRGKTVKSNIERIAFLREGDNYESNIGLVNHEGDNKIDGNVKYFNTLTDSINYEIGIERGIIDSKRGLDGTLMSTVLYVSGDYYNKDFNTGLALVPTKILFEDNGYRNQMRAKLYHVLGYGIHAYIRGKHYTNSKPYNGTLFSPESYERVLYGFGFRRYIKGGFLSGHIDKGYESFAGVKNDSWTYRLHYGYEDDDMTYYVEFAEDINSPFYTYSYGSVGFLYKF